MRISADLFFIRIIYSNVFGGVIFPYMYLVVWYFLDNIKQSRTVDTVEGSRPNVGSFNQYRLEDNDAEVYVLSLTIDTGF